MKEESKKKKYQKPRCKPLKFHELDLKALLAESKNWCNCTTGTSCHG